MSSTDRTRLARAVLLCAVCGTTFAADNVPDARAGDVIDAVWKEQRITFAYRSADSMHTCAGLRTQLRSLLETLGARENMTIAVTGCDDPASTRVVSLEFASPMEATPENLSGLDAHSPTERLAARVQGTTLETERTLERFPAEWRTISFANALRLRLTPADCELLKHLRRELMPKLTIRVLSDRMRCASDGASGHRPQLVVAALVAA